MAIVSLLVHKKTSAGLRRTTRLLPFKWYPKLFAVGGLLRTLFVDPIFRVGFQTIMVRPSVLNFATVSLPFT